MAKDSKKSCSDCNGIRTGWNGVYGDGACSCCDGRGYNTSYIEAVGKAVSLGALGDPADQDYPCDECSGTKQCQTCGGTGWEHYNEEEDDDKEEDDEDREENEDRTSKKNAELERKNNIEDSIPVSDEIPSDTGYIDSTDNSSTVYSGTTTPLTPKQQWEMYLFHVPTVTLFLFFIPLFNLVVLNVKNKTNGQPFQFFDFIEVGLELVIVYVVSFLYHIIASMVSMSIIAFLIKGKNKAIFNIVIHLILLLIGYIMFRNAVIAN